MSLDDLVARAIALAVAEGRLPSVEGLALVHPCHVLLGHLTACPMRRTQGRDENCTCGDRLTITLHAGDYGDCEACAERPSEH
jgi:hypothetical protein